jgi:hypothetical protein
MSKSKNLGTCFLCNETIDHRSIVKHINQCLEKSELNNVSSSQTEKDKVFLMKVFSMKSFWLYVETNGSATLEQLDLFLRDTWLECCGHMSEFSIGGSRYSSDTKMKQTIQSLLDVGTEFDYEYDFGSTTELSGKVISIRNGKLKKPIRLLARNHLPEDIYCSTCKKNAEVICSVCYEFCCNKCQKEHDNCEGEEFMLPVVNSPRMGVCGYTGQD